MLGAPHDRRIRFSVETGDEPLPGSQEWSTNLLGACADRANITMEGALYAKRRHGATASDLGHQQFAPNGRKSLSGTGT